MMLKPELYGQRKAVKLALAQAKRQGFPTRALAQQLQALEDTIANRKAWPKLDNWWTNRT